MKFKCINNDDVETLITVGKVYAGEQVTGVMTKIYRCDDRHPACFRSERFEPAEELVPVEPETFIYTYALETK